MTQNVTHTDCQLVILCHHYGIDHWSVNAERRLAELRGMAILR